MYELKPASIYPWYYIVRLDLKGHPIRYSASDWHFVNAVWTTDSYGGLTACGVDFRAELVRNHRNTIPDDIKVGKITICSICLKNATLMNPKWLEHNVYGKPGLAIPERYIKLVYPMRSVEKKKEEG